MKKFVGFMEVKFFNFFVALFALASVASTAIAQRNGAFVGLEIGVSGGGGGKI